MIRTLARTMGIALIAALTLAATAAFAQETRITGTVSRVDTSTRTIYFADGSVVRLNQAAVITSDGRDVALESLQPGTNATVVSMAASTPTVGTAPIPTGVPTGSVPTAVTGTVARVDPQTHVITLQDGRAIQLTNQSYVWQALPIGSIQPGSQIYVPNAQPLAMAPQPSVAAPVAPVNGVVRGVDRNNWLIALNDGNYIKVLPETRLQNSAGTPISIYDVRSGDEVGVWPHGQSNVSETATVSRGDLPPVSAIKADYIRVVRMASSLR